MKTFIMTTAAIALTAGAAFADGPICEREITLYQDGQLVDTSTLTFYPHGCDRFQYQPMTEAQVLNLGAHCSVESYASGGTEEEEVTEEVEGVLDYDVSNPQTPWGTDATNRKENFAFNGVSVTHGDNVFGVYSPEAQTFNLERVGTGVVRTVEVGPGYTLVRDTGFNGSAQYDGYFSNGVERGRHTSSPERQFDDTTVEEVTRTVTVELDEAEFYQPGPRTDRCGFPGEAIN